MLPPPGKPEASNFYLVPAEEPRSLRRWSAWWRCACRANSAGLGAGHPEKRDDGPV